MWEIPSMSLIWLSLRGGYLAVFVRFRALFWAFWRGRRGVPSASGDCLAVATIFRRFSSMEFALWLVTSIVRFWGIIACKVGWAFFELRVFFVGFSGGAEIVGLDGVGHPRAPER